MTCPICAGPTARNMRPFCSKRCADIDLGRWLGGVYAVPSDSPDDIAAAQNTAQDDTATDRKTQ